MLPQDTHKAFSLVELIVVMGILVVMAGIALPRYGAAHMRYCVDLAARRLAAELAHAQRLARQSSRVETVAFDASANTCQLIDVNDVDRAGEDYIVRLSDDPYGSEVVSVSFENANGYIGDNLMRFDMWGRPENGNPSQGEPFAPLVDGSIVLQAGTETRTITIAPVTGKVSIQ